ncbi:hypothetical protein [Arhodomonas sp. AD133]|uniref:hypothetical protein n=1 Tax=Arhodomonas sp. AD133 TaxID=3415009 RepID=UPI003EBA25B1
MSKPIARRGYRIVAMLTACLLAACTSLSRPPSTPADGDTPPPIPVTTYHALAAGGEPVYRIDADRSRLWVVLYRAGALGEAGHNHVIAANDMTGYFGWRRGDWRSARADLSVPVTELVADPPGARRGWESFFGEQPPPSARAATQENLRGASVLDAQRYPRVRVSLAALTGAPPRPVARFTVWLGGRRRSLSVPVALTRAKDALVVEGRIAVRHEELGLTPFAAFGGALRVADPMVIDFRLHAEPWSPDGR